MLIPRALLLSWLACAATSHAAQAGVGVVVEEVGEELKRQRVDLEPGDTVTGWSRNGSDGLMAKGDVKWPFDLRFVGFEHVPRGGVVLDVIRQGESRRVPVAAAAWPFDVTGRPVLPPAMLGRYEEGRTRLVQGQVDDALARWREAAAVARDQSDDPAAACWMLARISFALTRAGRKDEALQRSQHSAIRAGEPRTV